MKKKLFVLLSLSGIFTRFQAQEPTYSQAVVEGQTTVVTITESTSTARVNPMIYGQMLEDCNDAVIYGGVVNNEGKENEKVIDLLKAGATITDKVETEEAAAEEQDHFLDVNKDLTLPEAVRELSVLAREKSGRYRFYSDQRSGF